MRSITLLLGLAIACGGAQDHSNEGEARGIAEPKAKSNEHGHGHAGHGDKHGHAGHKSHKMPHSFRGAEEWAKRFDNPKRDEWQKPTVVIEHMKITSGMTVVDIGAGTGYFVQHLSKAVGAAGRVLAHDIEKDMVRYLGERSTREDWKNVDAEVVPPDSPGLEANSVDRVLVVNTWHHIQDRKVYAAKVAAGLKPSGGIIVVDFHPHSEKGPPKKHKLAPSVVVAELSAAGLEVKVLLDKLPEQYIVTGFKK